MPADDNHCRERLPRRHQRTFGLKAQTAGTPCAGRDFSSSTRQPAPHNQVTTLLNTESERGAISQPIRRRWRRALCATRFLCAYRGGAAHVAGQKLVGLRVAPAMGELLERSYRLPVMLVHRRWLGCGQGQGALAATKAKATPSASSLCEDPAGAAAASFLECRRLKFSAWSLARRLWRSRVVLALS
jgi:hypothetical protein